MNVEERIKIEKRIIERIVTDALAAGYGLGVFDGEERTLKDWHVAGTIMEALMTTDADHLEFYLNHERVGWVLLIYGNDGYDVMADYTVNLEEVLKGANELATKIEEEIYG